MYDDWYIFIVEDEADSADVVSRIFKFHKIRHQVAGSAEDALTLMETEQPTALIVDLSLPGMDGWQLIDHVRKDWHTANLPAVAVTAYHTTHVADEAIRAGFNAYFAKPIEATTFIAELARALDNIH